MVVATAAMAEFQSVIDRLAPYGQPSSTMVLSTPLAWRPVEPTGSADQTRKARSEGTLIA